MYSPLLTSLIAQTASILCDVHTQGGGDARGY